jgi:hypothetical protein
MGRARPRTQEVFLRYRRSSDRGAPSVSTTWMERGSARGLRGKFRSLYLVIPTAGRDLLSTGTCGAASDSRFLDGSRRFGMTKHQQIPQWLAPFRNDKPDYFPDLIWVARASISSGFSLPVYFGIRCLPLVMMLRRSSADIAVASAETSDGPPKWRPSAVLP